MQKLLTVIVLAAGLAACGVFDALVDGFKHTKAIETDLEQTTGVKPEVGFKWNNGRLLYVEVKFPSLYDAKPLRELAATVRTAVAKEFQQIPEDVVLSFSSGRGVTPVTAQAGQTRQVAGQ